MQNKHFFCGHGKRECYFVHVERDKPTRQTTKTQKTKTMKIEEGTQVLVSEEGQEATVIAVSNDGMIEVEFSDGEIGSYSANEVEAI